MSVVFDGEGCRRGIESEFLIVDKHKQEVPFLLNKAQIHFVTQVMTKYEEIVILKARKMGFSSVVLAIIVLKFLLGKNENCVSMSFDATAASKQLERAKKFIRAFERLNKMKIPFKYNSKKELVYQYEIKETGEEVINTIRIGAATSKSFGRGDDVTFLHVTETSLCDDMDALMAGIGEACLPGAFKIFETTANGHNSFKQFWDKAVKGINGFFPVFYGPEWEYSKEFIDRKRSKLGRIGAQEYPKTAKEAFLTSGECFFDADMINSMLEEAEKVPYIDFQFQSIDKNWKQKRVISKGEFLLFPVDTSGDGSDNTTCTVISKNYTDNPIVYNSDQSTSYFVPELVRVLEAVFDFTGVKPCVAFERQNGGAFLMDRVAAMNHLGKFDIMLMPDFGKQDGQDKIKKGDKIARTNKFGWDTNSSTRGIMLDDLEPVMNTGALKVYDVEVLGEALSFVKKNGKPQAESGSNDDLIMALAIGYQMYLYQPIPGKKEKFDYDQYKNYEQPELNY
jgi:hypothetical protein